jgi:hypothetical protein
MIIHGYCLPLQNPNCTFHLAKVGQNGHLTHRGAKRTQRTKRAKAYETDKYDESKQVENDSEKVGKVPTPRYSFA